MSSAEIDEINYLTYNYICVCIWNICFVFLHAHVVQPAGKAMSRLPITINIKYIVLISVAFVLGEMLLSRE